MFTAYDKAGAAAIGSAITAVLAAVTDLSPEALGAIGTLVTTLLVFLIPNKQPE